MSQIDRASRRATLTVSAPSCAAAAATSTRIVAAGCDWWPLAMARELDDAILMLRTNQIDIGTWLLKTRGDADAVLAVDAALDEHRAHWFVRETIGMLRRTLGAPRCFIAHAVRVDRTRIVLRRHAVRARARCRPQLHGSRRYGDRTVAAELRHVSARRSTGTHRCAFLSRARAGCDVLERRSAKNWLPVTRSNSA